MRRCARTPARTARDADSRARARLVAAIACSLAFHALITAGVPPGQRGRSGGDAPSSFRALEVELLDITPEPPVVSAPAGAESLTVAAPRIERRKAQESRAAAVFVEGAPRPASAGPPEIPDPTYYGARQLDVYPVLASTLRLGDREGAPTPAGIGRVLLLVLIDAEGLVNEVSVVEAEPTGVFEEHTRAAFQAARFTPALKNGRPVKSRLLVAVDYSDSAKR